MKDFYRKQENSGLFLMNTSLSKFPNGVNHYTSENTTLELIKLISNNNLYQSARLFLKFFTIFTYWYIDILLHSIKNHTHVLLP